MLPDNDNRSSMSLRERILESSLCVGSGVLAVIDPSLDVVLTQRGEYRYAGLDAQYEGPIDRLAQVSALAGVGPREDEIAKKLFASQRGVRRGSISGYSVGSFAGWTLDQDLRAQASSGGLATWVLLELLRLGRIDGVIHMAPSGESGTLFRYRVSRTAEEIREGSKSKYYPGELSSSLREIIDVPGRYAIVGIPSLIYEVRLLQELEPVFQQRIPYTVGLICGHQKTTQYATCLAWGAGFHPGQLRQIDFRKKIAGQPANSYSTEFTGLIDGREVTRVLPQTMLPGTDWGLGFFKSNFSDLTQDAFNETADIVLGDAWLPEYVCDGRGTNVVLVRNAELLGLLMAGERRAAIHLDQLTVADVLKSQSALVRQSVHELPYRFGYLAGRGEYVPPIRRGDRWSVSPARRLLQRRRLETSRVSHEAFQVALRADNLLEFDRTMAPIVGRYRHAQRLSRLERLLTGRLSSQRGS